MRMRMMLVVFCLSACATAQTYTESILHNFGASAQDSTYPYAGLVMDKSGNLYGATTGGGSKGKGVVFKLNTKNTETILHAFTGGNDGFGPANSLCWYCSVIGVTFAMGVSLLSKESVSAC